MRLRNRLFVWFVAVAALGTLLLAGFVFVSFHQYELASVEADLEARSTALAETVSDLLARHDTDYVNVVVARYGAQEDIWLRVFDPAAHLIASSSPDDDQRVSNWRTVPGMNDALAGRAANGISTGVLANDDRMYVAVPLRRDGRLIGVLRISRTLASFNRLLGHTAWLLGGAFLAILLFCALVSARVAESIAGPIQRMRDFAVSIGAGRFGDRLPPGRYGEIRELTDALNEMSQRLAGLDEERRSFLANASHELRTPITNVHATLDALENGAADDPDTRRQFLRMALNETERMVHLIESLLDLGRLEAGVAEMERRPVDLSRLLQRAVAPLQARFDAAGVLVETVTQEAWTDGDPERLLRALLNVLDNALKHSRRGGSVEVTLEREGRMNAIAVRDDGPGFDANDLPRVFEQFFSAERAGGPRGSGLGLAIAKRIVESSSGSITAANRVEGGALVTLRLPARDRPETAD